MNPKDQIEVQQIQQLQTRIEEKLQGIGFKEDPDTEGNLIHHLAELAVVCKKLEHDLLPGFLDLPTTEKEELGELVIEMNYEILDLKDSLTDLEPALLKLMNFLTGESGNRGRV